MTIVTTPHRPFIPSAVISDTPPPHSPPRHNPDFTGPTNTRTLHNRTTTTAPCLTARDSEGMTSIPSPRRPSSSSSLVCLGKVVIADRTEMLPEDLSCAKDTKEIIVDCCVGESLHRAAPLAAIHTLGAETTVYDASGSSASTPLCKDGHRSCTKSSARGPPS